MDIGTALSLLLVGLMVYHFVRHRGGPFVQYLISLFVYPAPRDSVKPARLVDVQEESVRSNGVQPRSAQQEAIVQDVQRSNVQAEPSGMEPPTLAELRLLAQAIGHNARGETKQASIERAFGVKKGGSSGWRRASQLFDEAMKDPEMT